MLTVFETIYSRLKSLESSSAKLHENVNERISELVVTANWLNANGHISNKEASIIEEVVGEIRRHLGILK